MELRNAWFISQCSVTCQILERATLAIVYRHSEIEAMMKIFTLIEKYFSRVYTDFVIREGKDNRGFMLILF